MLLLKSCNSKTFSIGRRILLNNTVSFQYFSNKNNLQPTLTPISVRDDDWIRPKTPTIDDLINVECLSKKNKPHDEDYYIYLINNAFDKRDMDQMITILYHDILVRDKYLPSIKVIQTILKNISLMGGSSYYAFKLLKTAADIDLPLYESTYNLLFTNCKNELKRKYYKFHYSGKAYRLISDEEQNERIKPAIKCFNIWKHLIDNNNKLGIQATNSLIHLLGEANLAREAFIVYDHFTIQGYQVDGYTLNALLKCCSNSFENGLGIALIIFHKLCVNKRMIQPDSKIFNLLLQLNLDSKSWNDEINILLSQVRNGEKTKNLSDITNLLEKSNEINNVPMKINVTSLKERIDSMSNLVDFKEIQKNIQMKYDIDIEQFVVEQSLNNNKLLLYLYSPLNLLESSNNGMMIQGNDILNKSLMRFGGLFGFLKVLDQYNIKPDEILMCTLLKILPLDYITTPYSMNKNEKHDFFSYAVQKLAHYYNVKVGSEFQNIVLKRQILLMKSKKITEDELIKFTDLSSLDYNTWLTLASKCETWNDVVDYLNVLSGINITITESVFRELMKNCFSWKARCHILKRVECKIDEENWKISRLFLGIIESCIAKEKKRMKKKNLKNESEQFRKFQLSYVKLLEKIQNDNIEKINDNDENKVDEVPPEYIPRDALRK